MAVNIPTRNDMAPMPDWLIQLTTKPAQKPTPQNLLTLARTNSDLGRSGFSLPAPGSVSEGGRNDFMMRACGWLMANGLHAGVLLSTARTFNTSYCNPPLDDSEVEQVVASAQRYAAQHMPANSAPPTQMSDAWPDPLPIRKGLLPVPELDCRWLPNPLRDYVKDVSERMSCPPDFPAVAALVAVSSAIGSKLFIKPKRLDSWMLPGGLWGMLVGIPGAMKSPPLEEMLDPLRALDHGYATAHALEMQSFNFQKQAYEHAAKVAAKNPEKGEPPPPPTPPRMRRAIVNDATYETLITIAADNPEGFLMYRDELAGWLHSLDKENQKEARGLFLTAWSGTSGYATDRIGRGHIRADLVNISVIGTIQPSVLKGLFSSALDGGSSDDGLLQRMQLAVFPDPEPYTKVDRYPDLASMQSYHDLVKRLAVITPAQLGAQRAANGRWYLSFSDEAQELFFVWLEQLEARVRKPDTDEPATLIAHLSKYRSLVPKLALTFHLAAGGHGVISAQTLARAIHWSQYLEQHARRIYQSAESRPYEAANKLARKIKDGDLADGFTRSDVLLKSWSLLRTGEEVEQALAILRDHNWIEPVRVADTGGRPATRYTINPKLKS